MNTFRGGSKLRYTVAKGESASIEFPAAPQIATWTGTIQRGDEYEMINHDDYSWQNIMATAAIAVTQVYASAEAALFVTGDDSLWGVGYRANGNERNLRKIETPAECRNFKKIAHGKFFRVALT